MSWFAAHKEGTLVRIHAQPGAKRTEVVGLHGDCLKLRLASPPVDGKANACLIEFLAQRLGVGRNQIRIAQGANARRKTIIIATRAVDPRNLLDA